VIARLAAAPSGPDRTRNRVAVALRNDANSVSGLLAIRDQF
jgi:hypothetical protein